MTQLISLDEKTAIAGQLQMPDFAQAAAQGFTLVVNNRPDGESFGQPKSKDLAAEAGKLGLGFVNLPFSMPGSLTPAQVAEFARLLSETDGKVLAFCRSGNRSTILWAAANAALGVPLADILAKAAKAGYDLRQAAGFIEGLGKAAARA